jgi:hypothetical protein
LWSKPGRADDRWGVAWCDYLFSRDLKSGIAQVSQSLNDERVLEAYCDMAVVDHIRFGPDAQAIWPGTRQIHDALLGRTGQSGVLTFRASGKPRSASRAQNGSF